SSTPSSPISPIEGNHNSNSSNINNNLFDCNDRAFKKGHKKNKSSKIEFNFDPDAFEGSTRILDVFDFPSTFKTHHLHEIFQEYENMRGGYRIKWMEDTPRKAYLDNVANQMATIKPYEGPTDFLQKTKRLVHGALGVRVVKTPEQKQADNYILRIAKEQKEQRRTELLKRSNDLDNAFNE
ncbi:6408_t:CDS:2, partial [Entrophospora sp. SA101]